MKNKDRAVEEWWQIIIVMLGIIKDLFSGIREIEWKQVIINVSWIAGGSLYFLKDISFQWIAVTFILALMFELRNGRAKEEDKMEELFVEKYGRELLKEKKRLFRKLYGFDYGSFQFYLLYFIFKLFGLTRYMILRI